MIESLRTAGIAWREFFDGFNPLTATLVFDAGSNPRLRISAAIVSATSPLAIGVKWPPISHPSVRRILYGRFTSRVLTSKTWTPAARSSSVSNSG